MAGDAKKKKKKKNGKKVVCLLPYIGFTTPTNPGGGGGGQKQKGCARYTVISVHGRRRRKKYIHTERYISCSRTKEHCLRYIRCGKFGPCMEDIVYEVRTKRNEYVTVNLHQLIYSSVT